MFPPVPEPDPQALAQAALFVVLRDIPTQTPSSPWSSLGPRRFGGDVYERLITFQSDNPEATTSTVNVKYVAQGTFDVIVHAQSGQAHFSSVPAHLSSSSVVSTLADRKLRTTIVSQRPAPTTLATAHTGERLHVFHSGKRYNLLIPAPKWLQTIGESILHSAKTKGEIRAPMPSLVVDVRVRVGDAVDIGQAVVVLESMKTETVLRAGIKGVVKSVACQKGEMVEEGRELVDVEPTD